MVPLNKERMVRPRLDGLEVEAISYALSVWVKHLEAKPETKHDKATAWVRKLSQRFQHLEKQNKYLRPRR
jgi:hypothetical protein